MGGRPLILALLAASLSAQVIEFESAGLRYQALTRNGLTIMFAQLPSHVREYSILQVAVSNGGTSTFILRPEDFVIRRGDGTVMQASSSKAVVRNLVEKASRTDVIKLVTAYEQSLYGNYQYKATNGFEERRRSAFGEVSSVKLKAAAAASAIAFVPVKIAPGQSTDGAVFYSTSGRPLGPGQLTVRTGGAVFEFPVSAPAAAPADH